MTGFALNGFDAAIIIGSIVIVIVVGLLASRNSDKSATGFFLASGRMPWYIIGSAFVSTSVSSEQIVGTVGAAYTHGMGVANWEWWSLPTYSLLLIFFIPVYLKSRVTTVPEFLTRRFGSLCGNIYSWIMVVAYVFVFQVPVIYGGTLALSDLTGWSFQFVLWVLVISVGIYAVKGGLTSVMFTDAVQCLMLIGGGLILFFIALRYVPGGWTAMAQASPERFHLYHPPSDKIAPFPCLLMASVGVSIFYQAGNQVMIQRVFSARSTWDGLMGIIFAGMINLLRPLVTCFLGFIVFHWIHVMKAAPALEKPDLAFPFAMKAFAPEWGLRGIILAGFLAAVMSTMSALANSTATIFSLDIYKKLMNRKADDKTLVRVGQCASALALVIAALVSPWVEQFGGIFQYFQTGVTYLATPFISVIILGLLWRRTTYQAALFGLIGGTAIQVALALGLPAVGIDLHWLYVAFIAQVIIMFGIVVVSLLTPAPAKELWEPFQWSPKLIAGYSDGIKRPWYHSLYLWFSVYAAAWFLVYWRFW